MRLLTCTALIFGLIGPAMASTNRQRASVTPPAAPQVRNSDSVVVSGFRLASYADGRWRYRYYNGAWWYWLPSNQWVYWRGGRWVDYAPRYYSAPRYGYTYPYYGGYRGYYPDYRPYGPRAYSYGPRYYSGYRGVYPAYGRAYRDNRGYYSAYRDRDYRDRDVGRNRRGDYDRR